VSVRWFYPWRNSLVGYTAEAAEHEAMTVMGVVSIDIQAMIIQARGTAVLL
jgi:hypothetical protein